MAPAVNRILLIKLRAIGDVVLSTAVIPGLNAAWPGARVDFLTEAYCAPAVEGHPGVSEILAFDQRSQSGASLIRRVRRNRYDLVIDLFGNPRSAIVTLLSGARLRVGYRFNWRALCYNVAVTPRGGDVHNVEFNLDALRRLDVPTGEGRPLFTIPPDAEIFADRYFQENGLKGRPVVALNPGGGWISKKWRAPQYSELGRLIAADGTRLLVLWGPGEERDAEEVRAGIGEAALMAPPTTLKQCAALLRRSEILVTNDSGPMHVAAALGVPVVAVFGPTVPRLQGPVFTESEVVVRSGLECLGCGYTTCPIGNPCMLDLPASEVYAAFTRLRQRTESGAGSRHLKIP